MNIDELRAEIDKTDNELLELFLRRMELVDFIGEYKLLNNLVILDNRRELEILAKITSKSGTKAKYSTQLFQSMFSISKQRQLEMLENSNNCNIVLVGMPGCGKTTIGRALAEMTGKRLIDTDEEIVQAVNMTIAEYFEKHGEASFRLLERKAVEKASDGKGSIIATGGGVVVTEENLPLLRRHSRVYHLQRRLSLLSVHGRPLSQSMSLDDMYEKRLPLYEKFRDVEIDNNRSIEAAAVDIWQDFCRNMF